MSEESLNAEIAEESPPHETYPRLLANQEARDQGKAKPRHETIDRVGRGRTEARDETRGAAFGQSPPDAKHANGSHRGGDRKADDEARQEEREGHRFFFLRSWGLC